MSKEGLKTIVFRTIWAALVGAGAAPASAALISVDATVEVQSPPFATGEFVAGDLFRVGFVYDDSVIATAGPAPELSLFDGAVTEFSVTADSGNAGTWLPSANGVIVPGIASVFLGQQVVFAAEPAPGSPAYAGFALQTFSFVVTAANLGDPAGETFGAQLGGPLSGDLSSYLDASFVFEFAQESSGVLVGAVVTELAVTPVPTEVPEPGTMILVGSVLVGLGVVRRRRC